MQPVPSRAEGAFDAASDRFGTAERALDAAREERAQARRDWYAARQEHEQAVAAADRLQRLVTELAGRLDRMAELTGSARRGVTLPAPDGRWIVGVAALPARITQSQPWAPCSVTHSMIRPLRHRPPMRTYAAACREPVRRPSARSFVMGPTAGSGCRA